MTGESIKKNEVREHLSENKYNRISDSRIPHLWEDHTCSFSFTHTR